MSRFDLSRHSYDEDGTSEYTTVARGLGLEEMLSRAKALRDPWNYYVTEYLPDEHGAYGVPFTVEDLSADEWLDDQPCASYD
jgi:hypothetical protein